MVDLVNEGCDLAIHATPQHREPYVARHLAPIRMVICASPAYVAKRGAPQTAKALTSRNCLTKTAGVNSETWTISRAGNSIPVKRRG